MRRLLGIICVIFAAICLNSCSTDYYEPVFGLEDLPAEIPADGGVYNVAFQYQLYATKANSSKDFEFEYRIVIGTEIVSQELCAPGSKSFKVGIPSNMDRYSKPVVVEASTHVYTGYEDWWGDWTPVCSAVQLGR